MYSYIRCICTLLCDLLEKKSFPVLPPNFNGRGEEDTNEEKTTRTTCDQEEHAERKKSSQREKERNKRGREMRDDKQHFFSLSLVSLLLESL